MTGIPALTAALDRSRGGASTSVIVIDTSAVLATGAGGAWWDVPVAEVSESAAVQNARREYQRLREEKGPK